jgi:hypothetical protein
MVKSKGKVVPVLWLSTTPWRRIQGVGGGVAPRIFDLGTRCMWVVSFTPRPRCHQGKRPWYPLAEWTSEQVWTRWWREKFAASAGIRTKVTRSLSLWHLIKCVQYQTHASWSEFRSYFPFFSSSYCLLFNSYIFKAFISGCHPMMASLVSWYFTPLITFVFPPE